MTDSLFGDLGLDPTHPEPRVLVTGSRDWDDRESVIEALHSWWVEIGEPDNALLIHGAARGADTLCKEYWESIGLPTKPFEARWRVDGQYRKWAGNERNTEMVKFGADVCIAFPLESSIGTLDCIKKAEKAGIEVRVVKGNR